MSETPRDYHSKPQKKWRGLWPSGRNDGRRIKSQPALNNFIPYIMKRRAESSNYYMAEVDCAAAEKYIRQKRIDGLKGFGMLHFWIATYVRIASQRPGINRFIAGRRLYARKGIEICLAVKKDYSLDGQETVIKIALDPADTAEDVFYKVQHEVEAYLKCGADTNADKASRVMMMIPGMLLRLAVKGVEVLDWCGLLPRSLTWTSPFHGSLFVADLGSIVLPPLHHHLYHFGNVPLFLVIGGKKKTYELNKQGEVVEKKMLPFSLTLDERITDGFYFAGVQRMVFEIFKDPSQLDAPPEMVVEDIK